MRDLEREGLDGLLQEGHSTARGFIVLDREMDEAGGAVDGDIEVPLAALAISGAQLGQVLHVHMHEAEIVVLEGPVRLAGAACGRQTAQALGFQDAVDRVAIEMRQEVGDHKGEIIQRTARRTPQGADDGPLFVRCFPGELMRAARVVLAVGRSARPVRACATCGWSRWTPHSGGPAHPWARSSGRSRPGPPGWCGRWRGLR